MRNASQTTVRQRNRRKVFHQKKLIPKAKGPYSVCCMSPLRKT